jgi:hypothetical protein
MASLELPTVTTVVAAYNYAQYVGFALESALTQEYPRELLDVVVVDDGSQDNTADVVRAIAERHPGRVQLVQQENSGLTAAINRARQAATGELIALLDADDVWLPGKTARQVEIFVSRPEVSGLFSNMMVIDGGGRQSAPLWSPERMAEIGSRLETPGIGQFPELLSGNFGTHSSMMIRADAFDQVPAALPYPDYWVMIAAARDSRIELIPECLALYRIHGANLTGGVSGGAGVRERLKTLWFRLWVIRHLDLMQLTPAEVGFIADHAIEGGATDVFRAADSLFVQLIDIDEEQQQQAKRLLDDAEHERERGDHLAAAVAALKSLAWNPYQAGVRNELREMVALAHESESRPNPLAGARDLVVLVDAEPLLADHEMLRVYGEEMSGTPGVTLAIDATRLQPADAAQQLHALVHDVGFEDDDELHMLAFLDPLDATQLRRVQARVGAVYTNQAEPTDSTAGGLQTQGALPTYNRETLPALRAIATGRAASLLASPPGRLTLVNVHRIDPDSAIYEIAREKLLVWKKNGMLGALDIAGWQTRNSATLRLIELADRIHGLGDFAPVMVHTGDKPIDDTGDPTWNCLSYSEADGYADIAIPDFLFDGWPEAGMRDYAEETADVAAAGLKTPELRSCGWIGNCKTHPIRWELVELGKEHPDVLDFHHMGWTEEEEDEPTATSASADASQPLSLPSTYMTLADQVRRWALLIDVEGRGYSARVKVLLHSGRPVLIQERPWREWFWPELRPMENFIPVKRDLSDLLDRVRWALANPKEAEAIGRAGQKLAQTRLTREVAVGVTARALGRFAGQGPGQHCAPEPLRPFIYQALGQVGAWPYR